MTGVIYFLQAKSGLIKIGTTRHPSRRIAEISKTVGEERCGSGERFWTGGEPGAPAREPRYFYGGRAPERGPVLREDK